MSRCKSSRRRSGAHRGFTLAELLSSLAILALLSSFVVLLVAPITNAPNKTQAKVDTLQTATQGLYHFQRDLRMADPQGIWECSSISAPACNRPPTGSSYSQAEAIVIVSPLQAGTPSLQFDSNPVSATVGLPVWSGVNVYWLSPNNSGSNTLMQQYVGQSTLGITIGAGSTGIGNLTTSIVNLALTSAVAASGPTIVASNVSQLRIREPSSPMVDVQIVAQSTVGNRTNETTYTTSTLARN